MRRTRIRDVEKTYSTRELVAKLRRLSDALETGRAFEIRVAGERLRVPADAHFGVVHEREDELDEVEFQVRWRRAAVDAER